MNSRSRLALSGPIAGGAIAYAAYRGLYIPAEIYGMNVGFAATELSHRHQLPLVAVPEVLGRLSWSVTGVFFVLAIVGSMLLLSCIVLDALRDRTRKFRYVSLATTVVAMLIVWVSSGGDNPFVVKGLNAIVLRAFELLNMPRAAALLHLFTPLLLVVTVMLIVAAWSTLLGKTAADETAETLKDQIRKLNTTLFVGAAMIVAGIVHANATHLLPGVLLNETRAAEWNELVGGLSASMGAVWTFILLGIYLPSIAVIRMRARELAVGAAASGASRDVDEWQSSHGLTPQFRDSLVQVIALLSPLIIGGPAAPLLQFLAG